MKVGEADSDDLGRLLVIDECCRSAAAEARLTCEDQLGERGDRVP